MLQKIKLFDSHCHLDDAKLAKDLPAVLERAAQNGLVGMATIGCDLRSSLFALHLAEKYPQVACAVGVHPSDCGELNEKSFADLAELAAAPAARAVGEIGLDYYWDNVPREVQRKWFVEQIHLAKDLHKPIVIHDREAHGDLFNIVRQEKAGEFGGIMHCFSGSWELAKEALRLNFYISIAGPVTYKNARQLPEVVKNCPLDRLLIETDSPYLTPEPRRGKTNEPANVFFVAEKVAALRGMAIEEIGEITTANALKFYGILDK
ncbi:MAG: TatD family hydrolase [Peptococcaceae bacterium]|jgi:TatD DNase family protein|nr:TatD family hydrolase [Peptococcaceae bacterium]